MQAQYSVQLNPFKTAICWSIMTALYRDVPALCRLSAMFWCYVIAVWGQGAWLFREVAAL